ncbi:phosphoglycolate phosphatase [Ramlibacter albus]|uniref:Phosphoglycolate phosphatase n=1 Tax=Ramlibacter albus TaxID=2079448 RepID=A0A923S172_9BURK|nr:phosphoglycolate phosphatase [Ramlibacter albus]
MKSFALDGLAAAIVDLDGTLIDTLGDFDVALNRVLREMALPSITRKEIERMIGKGSEHLIRSMLAHVGAAPERFETAWPLYQQYYLAINGQHSDLYPGALEGLRALKSRGLKLACLTNKPTAFALPLLLDKGVADFFEVTFGGDAFEKKKPDPLPLLKTCEALGVSPSATLMIGDSSNDARAARAAGCKVVLVTYGYNHGEPVHAVDADGFVDSIAQIQAGA